MCHKVINGNIYCAVTVTVSDALNIDLHEFGGLATVIILTFLCCSWHTLLLCVTIVPKYNSVSGKS
jgi:hypothetical protein